MEWVRIHFVHTRDAIHFPCVSVIEGACYSYRFDRPSPLPSPPSHRWNRPSPFSLCVFVSVRAARLLPSFFRALSDGSTSHFILSSLCHVSSLAPHPPRITNSVSPHSRLRSPLALSLGGPCGDPCGTALCEVVPSETKSSTYRT